MNAIKPPLRIVRSKGLNGHVFVTTKTAVVGKVRQKSTQHYQQYFLSATKLQ